MTDDHRQAARGRITEIIALLQATGDVRVAPIVAECEALARAIGAFHMEGIRFRIYNVDRLLRAASDPPLPAGVVPLLEDARHHLESAGFHTRSHQAPI